jgi:thiamine biosynthesis lipoprotein
MGTTVEIYLYAADSQQAGTLFDAAFEEIERIDATLSTYRPASEISRINARAGTEPVTTDPEVFQLINSALSYSRSTDGAFDITVGSLREAWGFFRGVGQYPTKAELDRAKENAGWQYVALDSAARTIQFLRPGLELDLGAIGKGYALDRAAVVLSASGVERALLGAGQSSYLALGAPPGKTGWEVRVALPDNLPLGVTEQQERVLSKVLLHDASLSTSGSSEKFFELEGRRYSHIIDPRTGRPADGMVQVTVVASTAAESDALSTSAFVLGEDHGATWLRERPGVTALLVVGTLERARIDTVNWSQLVESTDDAKSADKRP